MTPVPKPPRPRTHAVGARKRKPGSKLRGNAKRTVAQREADMAALAQWRIEGKSLATFRDWIAANRPYTLSLGLLYVDEKEVERRWSETQMHATTIAKTRMLAALDAQEREAWAEWHRSKQERMRRAMEEAIMGTDDNGKPVLRPGKRSVTQENQLADVGYQRLILDIHDRRAKILGLYAPTRVEATGADGSPLAGMGQPVVNVIVNTLTTQQTATWEDKVQALTGQRVEPLMPG